MLIFFCQYVQIYEECSSFVIRKNTKSLHVIEKNAVKHRDCEKENVDQIMS